MSVLLKYQAVMSKLKERQTLICSAGRYTTQSNINRGHDHSAEMRKDRNTEN